MKGFAKAATIELCDEYKTKLKEMWPKLQKLLIDLEDDPMPAMYKRRFFRKMYDAFDGDLNIYCGPVNARKIEFIQFSFFIF